MALRAVVYIRKSQKDWDNDSKNRQKYSFERQTIDIKNIIKNYNIINQDNQLVIVNEKTDWIEEDCSAKASWRPMFNTMIKRIRKNKYDVILCTELSRLSRNPIDNWVIVSLLDKHKENNQETYLKQIKTRENTFKNTSTDKFTLWLFLNVAKFENDQRASNTKSWLSRKREKWWTGNKAPLWYKNIWEEKWDKTVVPDWDNFEKLKWIWALFLTWNYSIPDIKKRWDELWITTWKNSKIKTTPWESAYRSMLSNRYYIWELKDWTDQTTWEQLWARWNHEWMISKDDFNNVQIILQKNWFKHQKIKDLSLDKILSEILVCWKCTTKNKKWWEYPTKMIFESKTRYTCSKCKHRYTSKIEKNCPKCENTFSHKFKKDEHRYYRCMKRCSHNIKEYNKKTKQFEIKSVKSIPAKIVENFIKEKLSLIHISDDLFKLFKEELYNIWLEKNQEIKNKREEIKVKINNTDEKLDKLSDTKFSWNLTIEEKADLEKLIAKTKAKIQDYEEELSEIREKTDEQFELAWEKLQTLKLTKDIFNWNSDFEPKRKMLLSLISNQYIKDEKWTTIWNKPFNILAEAGIKKASKKASKTSLDALDFLWLTHKENFEHILLHVKSINSIFVDKIKCFYLNEIK